MSKWTKATGKVADKLNSPLHRMHLAATEILEGTQKAYKSAGVNVPANFSIPIWMLAENGHPYRITIEAGPGVEAEYAIFNAQTRDAK